MDVEGSKGMSSPHQEQDRVVPDVLVKQWDRLCQDIRTTYVLIERLIAIGLVLAGAALAFKPQGEERQRLLNVLLPIPAYGIFVYGAVLLRGVMVYAGHRKYVEEKINRIAGHPFLLGQQLTARTLHSTLELFGALVACGVTLALVSANSVFTAWHHFPQFVTGPVTVLNGAGFVMCGVVVQKCRNAFQHSYQVLSEIETSEARRIFDADVAEGDLASKSDPATSARLASSLGPGAQC